jgi:hypothetical protein
MKFQRTKATMKLLHYVAKAGQRQAAWLLETFEGKYGHLLSSKLRLPVTSAGEPLPWYTYPAIEYLSQLDFSAKDVFEFGAGHGSQFWARRAKSVTSVESDRTWFAAVEKQKQANQSVILHEDLKDYAGAITALNRRFDIIVVDGVRRLECAKNALAHLAEGGMVILDNSDWHPKAAALLREGDLIEADFTGFGPVNNYTWTTSLFFHRAIRIIPKSDRLPLPGIGSLIKDRNAE